MKPDPVNSNAAAGSAPTVQTLLHDNELAHALPRLERFVLLSHASGMDRVTLLAHPERAIDETVAREYRALCRRRLAGEPVAYLVGQREFRGLTFRVTQDVLIPRPETELLVDAALTRLPAAARMRVLDLGTGSGAVAIALAVERPLASIVAVDASRAALDVARANATARGVQSIRFVLSDWFSAVGDECFDVIAGNPPYVPAADPHLAEGDLRFEPRSALASGADGLDAIRRIVDGARERLSPGGWLLLEHGYDQGARCRQMYATSGLTVVETLVDLGGCERVTLGRLPAR